MRIVRGSDLGSCAETSQHLKPVLERTFSVKIPFGDTYYFLWGDLERKYGVAKSRADLSWQDWSDRCVVIGYLNQTS